MELLVNRKTRTTNSTIGEFLIDGNFFCYCLEPTDRGLTSGMTLAQIQGIKVPDKTCIPTGSYKVTSYFSTKNGRNVPLLNNVPGYQFVEIHQGNFPKDTDGCLLLGVTQHLDYVGPSDSIVDKFYELFFAVLHKGEEVKITYQ